MKAASTRARRIRPLLLVLLWVWAGCIALVLDLFFNITEFDGIRPRADLYRGMRTAAHNLVGEPILDHETGRMRRGAIIIEPDCMADVRAMAMFCDDAGPGDRDALRTVALEAENPIPVSHALRALGRMKALVEDDALLKLLHDGRPRVRHELVLALGDGGPEAVPVLEPLLTHKDRKTRLLAIQALGKAGGPRAKRIVEAIAASEVAGPEERAFARAALAE